jgi:alkylation response protein AidB-like acyl-CoA dehydrogenase
MELGTPEQKARFLPKIASSEEVWAQGWSEPNAGFDMAATQATAARDGSSTRIEAARELERPCDIGCRDVDGCYLIVARKKDMILRGGFDVYPREVEEVLSRTPPSPKRP